MALELPYVSYNMFIDMLRPFKVVRTPTRSPERLRWVSSIHWKQNYVPAREMALVCKASDLRKAVQQFPEALILVLEDDCIAEDLDGYDSVMVIAEGPATEGLLEWLQASFLAVQSWTNEILRIEPSPQALKAALDKSGRLISAPLLLYERNNQPIAKSLFNVGNPLCKAYLSRENEVLNSVRMLSRSPVVFKGGKTQLIVENILLGGDDIDGLLLVALFEAPPTAGQRDLLQMLAVLLEGRPDLQMKKLKSTQITSYALFDSLVNGRYVGNRQLEDYAQRLGVPLDAEYRLYGFFPKENVQLSFISDLSLALRKVNKGKNIVVMYEDRLYLLLYSKGFDDSLSNKVVENQLTPFVPEGCGFFAVSQVYDGVTNLKYAFQQVDLVSRQTLQIDLATWFTMSDGESRRICYTFEEALRYLLVDSALMSPELRDFSFSHTILDKIIKEDAQNGCDDARMLALYIHHERKATVVAEKLHVHRNTVLYRVGKIADRFGLDFNESWTRERVLFDFAILYAKLNHNPDLFKKITGLDEPPSVW